MLVYLAKEGKRGVYNSDYILAPSLYSKYFKKYKEKYQLQFLTN